MKNCYRVKQCYSYLVNVIKRKWSHFRFHIELLHGAWNYPTTTYTIFTPWTFFDGTLVFLSTKTMSTTLMSTVTDVFFSWLNFKYILPSQVIKIWMTATETMLSYWPADNCLLFFTKSTCWAIRGKRKKFPADLFATETETKSRETETDILPFSN